MDRSEDYGAGEGEVDFAKIWSAELAEVCPELRKPESLTVEGIEVAVDESPCELAALCLSGGGIRSATFSLGVIQSLARCGLLGQFHYLSTVSGGGYIGSWLSTWRSLDDDSTVFAKLNELERVGTDPGQIKGLRADSNYITPRLGLLSADTWTVIALYIRNLLLNWLLFAPFFMGCLLVPSWWNDTLRWLRHFGSWTHFGLLIAGSLLLLFGLGFAVFGRFRLKDRWLSRSRFLKLVLAPLVASAICFSAASQAMPQLPTSYPYLLGVVIGMLVYFFAWLFGRVIARPSPAPVDAIEVIAWTASGAVVGAILTLGLISAPAATPMDFSVAIFGISWCVLAYLVSGDVKTGEIGRFENRGLS